jgi:GDP/UDP-N,N'-diacetylbacillosamine 2-epimerase (hydrolysing)
MHRLCVVTGTRAEYGLLSGLIRALCSSPLFKLNIVATGQHLSPEFGFTQSEIIDDGFRIDASIETLISGDSPTAISKSICLGLAGFADYFKHSRPDILIILGDRFEIFPAVLAAFLAGVPIAHINGGESTAGAFDEALRHSISKMAWWHFVAAEEYKNRVIQLGEDPDRVFNVGSLSADNIRDTVLLDRADLICETNIPLKKKNLLITYHPETLSSENAEVPFQALLDALDKLDDTCLIFTMPNSDSRGRLLWSMTKAFVSQRQTHRICFASLGTKLYLSTLNLIDGVVGNSSSGLTEAPTFSIGTINIGDRQKGRLRAASVIDCQATADSILKALDHLYTDDFRKTLESAQNPYGTPDAATNILNILSSTRIPENLSKTFFDI